MSIHHPLGFNWHPLEGAGRNHGLVKDFSFQLGDFVDIRLLVLGGVNHLERIHRLS